MSKIDEDYIKIFSSYNARWLVLTVEKRKSERLGYSGILRKKEGIDEKGIRKLKLFYLFRKPDKKTINNLFILKYIFFKW